MIEIDTIYNEDCLEGMKRIDDGAVDCIISDLPYGTTACSWDAVIPFEPLWEQFKRVIKPNAAIVLFGSEPFSSALRMSNIGMYRYDWVWVKEKAANFQIANVQPLKVTENICVFGKAKAVNGAKPILRFYPQLEQRDIPLKYGGGKHIGGALLHKHSMRELNKVYDTRHPSNILYFPKEYGTDNLHPTQKPVDLLRYLILTYTNEGDTVLDATIGSGTTAVAALMEHRHFIGFETDKGYYDKAVERIADLRRNPTLF